MRQIALWCLGMLVAAGAVVFVFGEFYNLTATRQHPFWVFRGLAAGRDTIVRIAAADVEVPEDFAAAADPAGAALYQKHCVQCHGAPGVAPEEFALGMMPVPSNLVAAARERPPEQIYWFVRYGLKMSGMPAWDLRMSEADMWRVTAFVEALPRLSPVAYAEIIERAGGGIDAVRPVAAGEVTLPPDPERGRLAMQVHGCLSCHLVPGMVGPSGIRVGPSLARAGVRRYIAGILPNTPENMARWIADPQEIDPLSAMPELGVNLAMARDIAAYLYEIAPERTYETAPEADPDTE